MAEPNDERFALEADPLTHLQRVNHRFGTKRVVIAHTIVPDIQLQQGGQLLRLDVHHAVQTAQAALFENGMLWRVAADSSRTRLL